MAQVKIPAEFTLQITLLNNIITKNSEPGFDSPLIAWLEEKCYDLAADQQAGIDAMAQEKMRAQQDAASKTAYKSRDNNIKPVFIFIRGGAQVLKKFYSANTAVLKDWNIPITDSGRIDYPSSFEERSDIATGFFTKLASFAAGKSPLAAYIKTNNIDVAALTKMNDDAAKSNPVAIASAKAAENATEMRDLLWKNALTHIREIADYLKSVYLNNPRALGDWGFVVDESTGTAKPRKVKFMIGETRILENIALGSIVVNLGKGVAIVYKGKGITGETKELNVNDKMGIVKGYSIITVVNPSTLETLELSILPPEK